MGDGAHLPALPGVAAARDELRPRGPSWLLAVGIVGVALVDVRTAVTAAMGASLFTLVAFVLLARGVVQRRRVAYYIVLAVLFGWVAVDVIKGVHRGDAVVTLAVAVLVLRSRPDFVVDPGPHRWRLMFFTLVPLVTFDVMFGFAGFRFAQHAPTVSSLHETVGRLVGVAGPLAVHGRGHLLFAATITGTGILSLASLLLLALAPVGDDAGPQDAERDEVRHMAETGPGDSLDPFALRTDKRYVLSQDRRAAVAYRYLMGVGLASGDPVGHPAAFEDSLREFVARCDDRGWRPIVLLAGEDRLAMYHDLGFKLLYMGDEALLDVGDYSLAGRRRRNVRQAVSRAANFGVTTDVVVERDLDDALRRQLVEVGKRSRGQQRELGFTTALDEPLAVPHPDGVIAICRGADGTPVAFQRYLPCKGGRCLSLDAMRRDPAAPNGINEAMIVHMLRTQGDRGVRELSVNFVGFRTLIQGDAGLGSTAAAIGWFVRGFNPFKVASLYRFSAKFQPRWEARYIAYRSAADIPAIGLAALTAEGFLPFDRQRRNAKAVSRAAAKLAS
jgi:lysyl-tRNA synthetase class 2